MIGSEELRQLLDNGDKVIAGNLLGGKPVDVTIRSD
jgi:hypothetical protein